MGAAFGIYWEKAREMDILQLAGHYSKKNCSALYMVFKCYNRLVHVVENLFMIMGLEFRFV